MKISNALILVALPLVISVTAAAGCSQEISVGKDQTLSSKEEEIEISGPARAGKDVVIPILDVDSLGRDSIDRARIKASKAFLKLQEVYLGDGQLDFYYTYELAACPAGAAHPSEALVCISIDDIGELTYPYNTVSEGAKLQLLDLLNETGRVKFLSALGDYPLKLAIIDPDVSGSIQAPSERGYWRLPVIRMISAVVIKVLPEAPDGNLVPLPTPEASAVLDNLEQSSCSNRVIVNLDVVAQNGWGEEYLRRFGSSTGYFCVSFWERSVTVSSLYAGQML